MYSYITVHDRVCVWDTSVYIYIYIYIHLKVTSWSLCTSAAHSFSQTLPKSLRFTCSPQVCLGLVKLTTHTATGQVYSWTKLPGRPRLEPVPQVSPRTLVAQVGWCLVTPDNPENSCVLACEAGTLNLCGRLHRRSAIRVGWVGLKTKWMLFWLISLSQNVASIGSLKDDSCTPKPAKLNACNIYVGVVLLFLFLQDSFHLGVLAPRPCALLRRMRFRHL